MTSSLRDVSARFVESYYQLYAQRAVSSKKEFCESVGIFYTNFWAIEQGNRNVTLEHIINLANTHNISLDWLFFGNGQFQKIKKTIKLDHNNNLCT